MKSHLPCPPQRTASLRCCSGSSQLHAAGSKGTTAAAAQTYFTLQCITLCKRTPVDLRLIGQLTSSISCSKDFNCRRHSRGCTTSMLFDKCLMKSVKCWRKLPAHLPLDNLYFWTQGNWWVKWQNSAFVNGQLSNLNVQINIWAPVWWGRTTFLSPIWSCYATLN